MTNKEDLFRDTFESLNSVASIDETATASETFLITGDSSKEVNDNDMPLIDTSSTDMLTTRSAYVLTLPKDSLATLQGTFLTLPFVKADRHFLNNVEPPAKKKKSDTEEQENMKEMVDVLVKTVMDRLQSIENKLEDVCVKCQNLEGKVDNMLSQTKNSFSDSRRAVIAKKGRPGGPLIVGVSPQVSGYSHSNFCGEEGSAHRSVSVNSEADYPDGSWLGDPDNPHLRVRCDISPKDLEYCNRMCTTPEKMSLTLLDYLFDRETQACSNISGTGKHGKKQLDPKKIYGIRCKQNIFARIERPVKSSSSVLLRLTSRTTDGGHLIHRFGISDQDWRRYRQNMDSKCRTAFRRKQKGMPLTVKGFRERPAFDDSEILGQIEKVPQTTVTSSTVSEVISEDNFPGATSLCTRQNSEANSIIPVKIESSDIDTISLQIQGITGSQIIHTDHGDIQVLHATPEQLAALKGGHDLQILADGNILSEMRIEDPLPS